MKVDKSILEDLDSLDQKNLSREVDYRGFTIDIERILDCKYIEDGIHVFIFDQQSKKTKFYKSYDKFDSFAFIELEVKDYIDFQLKEDEREM